MAIESEPLQKFQQLYERYQKEGMPEPSACVLATATPDGKPSARVILLKGFDERGFVFYTNLTSRKAMDLKANPRAALCFYWEPIDYQVRVEGRTQLVAPEEADAYFATRPRGSQIGAWASHQSAPLANRQELQQRAHQYESQFQGREVPRPDFWSGYRLTPEAIEFWRRKENRLHERILYQRHDNEWRQQLLFP